MALNQHEPMVWELEFPTILAYDLRDQIERKGSGFDVMIGNPPFLGGLKISTELGGEFLKYLKTAYRPTRSVLKNPGKRGA